MTARSWQVYHSDWQGEQFARLVSVDISAVAELNWSNVGNLGAPVSGMNEMPQRDIVRKVHLIGPTGARLALPIGSNDAGVYSVGGTPPQLTYQGVAYDITGFSGERRSLPH